jgi:hypothetical protein
VATLIRSRSWGQIKPPASAQIDWEHPLSQGLRRVYLFNEAGGLNVDDLTGRTAPGRASASSALNPAFSQG